MTKTMDSEALHLGHKIISIVKQDITYLLLPYWAEIGHNLPVFVKHRFVKLI